MASAVKTQAMQIATELQAEFMATLKAQVPSVEEAAVIQRVTETIAAAPFMLGNPAIAEQVALAKSTLANLALAHAIDAETATATLIHSAVAKAMQFALSTILTAAKLA